jgi:hypothetical protein
MPAKNRITRQTVDLSAWPDLVVIYLGMKARTLGGLLTIGKLGPQIQASVAAGPDGLLLHETFLMSLLPVHVGMRQYWRDLDCLERWTREGAHKGWWTSFLKDPGGTSFWHETYRKAGGFEAIYDALDDPVGLLKFAPSLAAKGPMLSARARLEPGAVAPAAPVPEAELG